MTLYIVTGAAGHLGSTIIRALLEKGQRVRGLILPGEQPVVSGPEYIKGDVMDLESMSPLFRRKEDENFVVIHTAGLIDATGAMTERLHTINVNGTQNILTLSREHPVEKLLYVSSVHAIPECNIPTIQTEIREFSPERVIGGYAKSKAEATQAVLDAAAAGLPTVVVHPSGIIGPYDEGRNHLVQLIKDFVEGRLPVCVGGGYDFVDVRDVAEGCILATERGRIGECYLLTGGYHRIKEILELVADLCGRKAPPVLPMLLVRMAEPVLGLWARYQGRRPLYTRYSLDTLSSPMRFSSEKAAKELAYHTRHIQITVRDTLKWLQEHSLAETMEA